MRQALAGSRGPMLARQPTRVVSSTSLPAPTEGWDTESPVAELPQTRALRLENWVPKGISLAIRKGYELHASGIAAAVETLMPYQIGATSKLFAAAGADVFDVTAAGAVGAASDTGFTSARKSFTNFTTAGGSFLWTCNGVDNPRHYDGTVWATPALTMPGSFVDNDIFYVFESKQRLFFLLKNSLTFGYLPVESVAGVVSAFNLGSVFKLGGRLVAGSTLSFDSGSGPDDFTVFLTNEGEIAIYQGSNPADANDWALVGNFYIGDPVGDRPIIDLRGDLGVITRDDVVQLSQAFRNFLEQQAGGAYLMGRIATPWKAATLAGRAFNGWEGLIYPGGSLMIVNAPTSNTEAVQFIRYLITGGMGQFTGWNFETFEIFNGRLYAGGSAGNVFLCDEGFDDNGGDITAPLQTAWSALGSRGVVKNLRLWRPIVTTETGAAVRGVGRVDYRQSPALGAFPSTTLTGALIWGSGLWGTGLWGGVDAGARQWRSISGVGHVVSILMEAQSHQSQFELNGIDLIFESGGPI